MKSFRFTLVSLALLLVASASASASSMGLHGRVIEVQSGDLLTVQVGVNRQAKVRIKGIDAPEQEQPWSDSAAHHLRELALGRDVTVEYTGVAQDGLIIGYVFLNDVDLGMQMVRDGVAWSAKDGGVGVGLDKRAMYDECEQLARKERRGIWQDEQPTPPWEWRAPKASAPTASLQTSPTATLTQQISALEKKQPPVRALRNENLRVSNMDWWEKYAPKGLELTAMLPAIPVQVFEFSGDVKAQMVLGDQMVYMIVYIPNKECPLQPKCFDDFVRGFRDGSNLAAQKTGRLSELNFQHNLPRADNYIGAQYQTSFDGRPGVTRLYITRKYAYALTVLGGYEGDPRVDKFLDSIVIKKTTN